VALHRRLLLLFAGLGLQLRGSKIRPKVAFSFGEVEDIIDRIRLVGEVFGGSLRETIKIKYSPSTWRVSLVHVKTVASFAWANVSS
jgi:hypothetical protein